jgi:hypothetical protein
MNEIFRNFLSTSPEIAIVLAVVLVISLYLFTRYLNTKEMKRFSLFMSIGIALLVILFIIAIFFPEVVPYYPYVILGLAIAIGYFIHQKYKY